MKNSRDRAWDLLEELARIDDEAPGKLNSVARQKTALAAFEQHEADVRADELAKIKAEEPTETGYTRAQFADVVDEAHVALHEAQEAGVGAGKMFAERGLNIDLHNWFAAVSPHIGRAHGALHRVGAGLARVGCATPDPEAQAIVSDLRESLKRELPCGHTLADLIGGTEPDGRSCITTCGACLEARQPEIVAANRFKRAVKKRADEIESTFGHVIIFADAMRFADSSRERAGVVELPEDREAWHIDAAAWLTIARRILDREAMSTIVRRLLMEWRADTAPMSSISRMMEHRAFRELVLLGTSALPALFDDLAHEPSVHVPVVLHAITGTTPIPKEHAGRVKLIAEDWLRWGRENGYVPWEAGR